MNDKEAVRHVLSNSEWWCPTCKIVVPSHHVTFEETHDVRCDGCGEPVTPEFEVEI
jgi:Zn finger protein HypA/HybF involved in hydrogenase expression